MRNSTILKSLTTVALLAVSCLAVSLFNTATASASPVVRPCPIQSEPYKSDPNGTVTLEEIEVAYCIAGQMEHGYVYMTPGVGTYTNAETFFYFYELQLILNECPMQLDCLSPSNSWRCFRTGPGFNACLPVGSAIWMKGDSKLITVPANEQPPLIPGATTPAYFDFQSTDCDNSGIFCATMPDVYPTDCDPQNLN